MANTKRDYYEVLGVSKDSNKDEIKRAYRKLAMKYHPDVNKDNPDAEKHFMEINQAYEVLSDPKKRATYDQFGHAGVDGQAGGFGGFSFDDLNNFNFGSIFEEMMGGGFGGGFGFNNFQRNPNAPRKGRDLVKVVKITLEQVAKGASVTVNVNTEDPCPVCGGKGYEKESDVSICDKCHGTGVVNSIQQTPFGTFQSKKTCNKCKGTGKIINKACSNCHGKKTIKVNKNIKIDIPKGIQDGMELRVKGRGEAGFNGGPTGDLYLKVKIIEAAGIERRDTDLYIKLPMPIIKLMMGTEVHIPLFGKDIKFDIKAMHDPSDKIRIKGKGLPKFNSAFVGNLYIELIPRLPKKLSRKAKKVLEDIYGDLNTDEDIKFLKNMKK
jgi:molecular chaperone DnaJ